MASISVSHIVCCRFGKFSDLCWNEYKTSRVSSALRCRWQSWHSCSDNVVCVQMATVYYVSSICSIFLSGCMSCWYVSIVRLLRCYDNRFLHCNADGIFSCIYVCTGIDKSVFVLLNSMWIRTGLSEISLRKHLRFFSAGWVALLQKHYISLNSDGVQQFFHIYIPSCWVFLQWMLRYCWLDVLQEEHLSYKNWVTGCWSGSLWSKVHMICKWSSRCCCHLIISCFIKILMFYFLCRLTQIVT